MADCDPTSLDYQEHFASEAALRDFAEALGRCLRGGEILALVGDLGAGKTTFTQSLARGLGLPEHVRVISPTFVLHRRYRGRVLLEHLDAYRLGGAADLDALGAGEIFEGGGVVVVEWADRVEGILPASAVRIEFEITGPESRRLSVHVPAPALLPAATRRALVELLRSVPPRRP